LECTDKQGRERPREKWVLIDNAHEALITAGEAKQTRDIRAATAKKQFPSSGSRALSSNYSLGGGLFRCDRYNSNMTGFHTGSGYCYVCGSQSNRKGRGCGPGVYVPQKQVEAEVLSGLRSVLDLCADPRGLVTKVNRELRQIWEQSSGYAQMRTPELRTSMGGSPADGELWRRASRVTTWQNRALAALARDREEIAAGVTAVGTPPRHRNGIPPRHGACI
jgi:hypothetical protein